MTRAPTSWGAGRTTAPATRTPPPGKVNDPTGTPYVFPSFDSTGYVLFGHDISADASPASTVSYMTASKSAFCYSALANGTITQYKKDGTRINP